MRKLHRRQFDQALPGSETFPRTGFAKPYGASPGQPQMADFACRVSHATQHLSIDDQARAKPSAKGQKDQMTKSCAAFSLAKMKFGQRACVAVVFDKHRQAGKFRFERRFQPHAMPTRQVRRINQFAFGNFQRAADGNADGVDATTGSFSSCPDLPSGSHNGRKRFGKRALGFGGQFFSLQNRRVIRAFDYSGFGSADIESENGRLSIEIRFSHFFLNQIIAGIQVHQVCFACLR